MTIVRLAALDDLDEVLHRTQAFNAIENIDIDATRLADGIRRLLADPSLGGVWLIERDARVIGHAVVTYGYDLEYAGRDAFLTEILIDEDARGAGAGAAALARIADELRAREIHALHLQVREENPALRLYERTGFARSTRVTMTKRL